MDLLFYASYIRHKGTHKHKPIWTCFQSRSGLMAFGWHSVLHRSVRFSLVLCFSIWLWMCAKCKQLSLCDVWIADDNPSLWMRSTESNLLCFLCAPQVHFLSSTIQTRKLTAFSSLSLCFTLAQIFQIHSLPSHSFFAKYYFSYEFAIIDHVVVEWQRIQLWRFDMFGMLKLFLLQIFFMNVSYLRERVRARVSSLYVGHTARSCW